MSTTKHRSLDEYVRSAWAGDDTLRGLDAVMTAIADGAGQVQLLVQAAGLADVLGTTGEINVQGEVVQRLDTAGSDIFVRTLSDSGSVAGIGSEEIDDPVVVEETDEHRYLVQTDPVDGSSNIDVAVSIGSIFGIWRRRIGAAVTEESLMRPGNEQVAAAYVLYGTSTVLVMAVHHSVQGFTLDSTSGVFRLTHIDMRFPDTCEYYSINEGNFTLMDPPTQQAVAALRQAYSLRYVGSMVADFHRNLLKGGIFLYPGDRKSPGGKLRLMYEANPLGFIAEQAGGAASTGRVRILDIQPERLHQRTPLVLGNRGVVEQAVATISDA
jgi:fructose-1,6-bisphosphatase I